MKQICVILISTLILTSKCLHIKYHQSPQSYLSTLQGQQNTLTTQLPTIKSQISQVLQQVAATPDILAKINLLQQAILKQKSQLSSLGVSLANPLNETTWSCQNYIGTSQQQLTTLSNNLVSTTNQLSTAVNAISNSTITPFFSPDATSALNTAKVIQKGVFATGGTQVPALNNITITNFLSPNWTVGDNSTIQQVDKQTQTVNKNNGFVSTCPLNTPFFDGKNCITCSNGQYFNVQTKACVTCNAFNPTTRTCSSNVTPPNPNNNTNTTNGSTNPTPKYNGTNLKQGLNRTILPPNVTVSSLQSIPTQPCPSAQPFYSNQQCINCLSPTPLFNYSSQQCTTCPTGANYIPDQHICLSPQVVYVTNLPAASNLLILPSGTSITDLQNQQQNSSTTQLITPCPIATPFYNNQKCISCASNQYFNIVSLKCQTCPANSQYNVTVHKCVSVSYYSNLTNRNWTSTNPNNLRAIVANASAAQGAIQCPGTTSFFDGSKCVGCGSDQYFNFDAMKCEPCPANTVFDANIHSCITSNADVYQTNPSTTPNLIYAGTSKGQWMTIYLQNQQNRQDCPQNQPFFDGITCITCPEQYPFFNLRYKICQACEINSTYDASVHQCLSSNGEIISQQPNIQKMFASIFA